MQVWLKCTDYQVSISDDWRKSPNTDENIKMLKILSFFKWLSVDFPRVLLGNLEYFDQKFRRDHKSNFVV